MNAIKFLLLLFSCVFSFSLKAQFYTYKEYNHTDGLKISQTLSASQDSIGNLYIGTDGDGIVKFNGNTFENILKTRIDEPHHVTGIVFKKQSVFYSTKYTGIYRYKNNRFTQIISPSKIKHGSLENLAKCGDKLLFTTHHSFGLCDLNGRVITEKIIDTTSTIRVIQILEADFGTIIFTNKGAYFVSEQKISRLNKWLNMGSIRFEFGSYENHTLKCYDVTNRKVHHFELTKVGEVINHHSTDFDFQVIREQKINHATSKGHLVFLSSLKNELFHIKHSKLSKIQLNSPTPTGEFHHLLIDYSGDYWINTTHGIAKVSIEPFTKIQLNQAFSSNAITKIYIGDSNDYILSYGDNSSITGVFNQQNYIKHENLGIYHVLQSPLGVLLCAKEGLFIYKNNTVSKATFTNNLDASITFAIWENGNLWFANRDKGLFRYDSKSKECKLVIPSNIKLIYYCGQVSDDGKHLYLGTNNQIVRVDLRTNKYKIVSDFETLGSYCGNATKDVYGNIWFTMDKGIAGILKDKKTITLTDKNVLPSILFYTLSSDLYGNLIIGTNLGIHILKMNEDGSIRNHKTYNFSNGFTGYETNMRSLYQTGNRCYVGTIQGLYIINTEILEEYPVPPRPLITKGRVIKSGLVKDVDNGQYLTFETVLSKNKGVDYYYRILGVNSQWIELSTLNELKIPELDNGVYQLEVKSTYNDRTFSDVAVYPITINNPVWESKWFIVIIILFLGFLNIGYLEWARTGMQIDMYEIDYTAIDSRFVPKILIFGALVNTFIGVIIHYFVDSELGNMYLNIIASILLLSLRFLVQFASKKENNESIINFSFYLAIIILFGQYFILLFVSNIHPYPVIAITIISSVLPYLIKNIYSIIIICLLQICISIIILLWVENPIFNGVLFMLAIGTSSSLTVLVTYLRNDSLEKMYFVSNILNKGNMIVIAFNQKGLVNYCSKNISRFFNIEFNQVIGKSISSLNPIVVSAEIRDFSMENEFEDGKVILAPMYNHAGEISWIEWSCKSFSNTVRVIMGQDVTEKLTLSTNYQSLVENAHDMIFNTDLDGNFIYLNEMSGRIFGYKNENLVGKNSIGFIHPDYREQVREFFRNQIINRIQNTYLEFPIKTKDGRTIWLGQNTSIVFEPGSRKRVSGFTALARDITEKRANDLLIEQQNKDITSSINSAKRIQYSLIPKSSEIGQHFDDYFVLFKPKDIVSGDFYWVHKQKDKLIFVLADCTGHGVPGAFMTILGINLLNQLIIERQIQRPEEILNSLNHELQTLLHQDTNTLAAEGIDALVVVFEGNQVHFASSGVALIHNVDNDFNLYRSTWDEVPGKTKHYTSQAILLQENDRLYLISNGFQSQFGSIRNKKFSFKRVLELLKTIHVENMPLQKKYFENAWSNWSEGHEQTDDITVIGLKGYKK